jgi:Flp pilus assembly pilin Flp
MIRRTLQSFLQLCADESGQDLIEYALLSTLIGFAGIVVMTVMLDTIGTTYGSWGTSTNDLWESPEPTGGS